jgi:hypothetical protein
LAGSLAVGAVLGLGGTFGRTMANPSLPNPGRGHVPRILVSTDIGGTDFDDFQSMVHILLYSDVLDLEGLISSPYGGGTKERILEIIDVYAEDYPNLRTHSPHYPTPDALRAITKKGASAIAPPSGVSESTEGSRWIIECARKKDKRPLDILVWGGIEDVAQALHDAPDILPNLRVHFIGGPNKLWSTDAYNYIETHHPELWMIEDNATYRGFFTGGDQTGEWGNTAFVAQHVAGHGALGTYFANINPQVKMGDTPTVVWFLNSAQDPVQPSWGGQYVPIWDGRKTVFDRLTTKDDIVEVYGIVEFVLPVPPDFGPTNSAQMLIGGRTGGPFPAGVREGDHLRFRWALRDPKVWDYVIQSNHPALNGLRGAVTAAPPPPERVAVRSKVHPNWWTDDQDPAYTDSGWVGAKHVSQWRVAYLSDFAERMDRCAAPARPIPARSR